MALRVTYYRIGAIAISILAGGPALLSLLVFQNSASVTFLLIVLVVALALFLMGMVEQSQGIVWLSVGDFFAQGRS